MAQSYGRLPTFCSFCFTEEKQLPWILWHLITEKRKKKTAKRTHPSTQEQHHQRDQLRLSDLQQLQRRRLVEENSFLYVCI
jgi:hypothetical protein